MLPRQSVISWCWWLVQEHQPAFLPRLCCAEVGILTANPASELNQLLLEHPALWDLLTGYCLAPCPWLGIAACPMRCHADTYPCKVLFSYQQLCPCLCLEDAPTCKRGANPLQSNRIHCKEGPEFHCELSLVSN